ncbi:hypothetical protein [Leptolyngbya sp. FACHB-261]|uniref:hypothetical protein n=1 Tax=Leptolyngbya sp. FACHB-261 TaxID=2692806 RepID=UPI001688A11C|nr:hypothetical protein [Leptolyngbya sp. FACHB-261]MBD2099720.1 hypothetical protein [Leptolyngbya sp. FACHB-261]
MNQGYSSSDSNNAIDIWRKKLFSFEKERAKTASAEQKFELDELIEECHQNIARLSSSLPSSPSQHSSAASGLEIEDMKEIEGMEISSPPDNYHISVPPKAPIRVFCWYSRQSNRDVRLWKEFKKRLNSLENEGLIKHWHEGYVEPGSNKRRVVIENLNSARIILPLMSQDFIDDSINSALCREVSEISLSQYKAKKASVIPVILRPCSWKSTPFRELEPLLSEGQHVTNKKVWPSEDEAFSEIEDRLRTIAKKMRNLS